MAKGCGICAYAQKENGKAVWCKFHREKVTENNTCDDFLDTLDSPVMSTLLESVTSKGKTSHQKSGLPVGNRIKDILAWILIVLFILSGILAFLYC